MADEKEVLIYGVGEMAQMVRYQFEYEGNFRIVGYCIERDFKKGLNSFDGLPLYDFDKIRTSKPPSEFELFIAVGNNYVRERIFRNAKRMGYHLCSFVESTVLRYENLKFGENVFISGTSALQPYVTVGFNTFIIGAKIGHHSAIGDHCLLSCCTLAGGVDVGNRTFIGMNSTIKQRVKIGYDNIIGMGSIISEDTGNGEVYSNTNTTRKMIFPAERIRDQYM